MTPITRLNGVNIAGRTHRLSSDHGAVSMTKQLLWVGLALVLTVLLTMACGGPNGSGSDDGLGVNTELGERTDPDGNPLPEGYHPLSKSHRTIAPLSELYYAGVTLNGKSQGLLDDQKEQMAVLHSGDEESWTGATLAAGKGDVDGDGYDEIVAVYHNAGEGLLKLRVVDRDGDTYTETTYTIAEGVELGNSTDHNLPPMTAIAVGDLDADGRDEIAFGIGNRLYLIDDSQANYRAKETVVYDAPDDNGLAMMQLGFGDFNGDGRDQLFVTLSLADASISNGRVDWYRYDSTLHEASASGELILDNDYDRHAFKMARMAVGDIDGDGLSEVVFNAAGNTGHYAFYMDDEKADNAIRGAYALDTTWKLGLAIATVDVDGDGVAEVLAGKMLLKYSKNTDEWTHKGTLPFEAIDEECSFWNTIFGCIGHWNPIYKPANALTEVYAAGDFNGDFREELALRRGMTLQLWGLDENGAFVPRTVMGLAGQTSRTPALVAANVDNDSLVVRYTGKKELLFSNPKVVAVMAAPPTWANKGQNVDGSGTTFGKSSATETESSETFGFNVGYSIGFSQEFSILGVANAGSFEMKASFEHAMNWTAMQGSAFETSLSYTSGPGEDKVIFTSIPFDVYYYEIISSPDASAVGEIISINVPREAQTIAVTREFYNAHNGDASDIDETVLGHTVGKPWSYPNKTDKDELLAARGGWVNSEMVTVGQGSGSATLTIASTETTSQGMSYDFDAKVEVEAGVAGVTAGVSAGFHYGTEYSVSASQGFFLEGTIGEIPAEHYNGDSQYRVGLFAYPHQLADGHQFMVINYWVAE